MRKFIVGSGLMAVFFGFYCAGAYLRSYPMPPQGTIIPLPTLVTTQPVKVPDAPLSAQRVDPAAAKALPALIAEEQGPRLAQALAAPLAPYPDLRKSLQQRFATAYPPTEHAQTKEAASRLSILQAMERYQQRAMPKPELAVLANFYREVSERESEHPAVRRQSLRNLVRMIGRLDEADRLKVLARAGRFLASATRSAPELAEEIFRAGSQPRGEK